MNKNSISPSIVVTVDFPGATGIKRRPALVISTNLYHHTRPDVIIGVLTSQISGANPPTDYVLQDWAQAGLRLPTAFRVYSSTVPNNAVTAIGHLSPKDWEEIQRCLKQALAVA
jgi:mRNA interferase MazF